MQWINLVNAGLKRENVETLVCNRQETIRWLNTRKQSDLYANLFGNVTFHFIFIILIKCLLIKPFLILISQRGARLSPHLSSAQKPLIKDLSIQ